MLTLFRNPSQMKVQPIIQAENFFIHVFNEFNKINKCTVLYMYYYDSQQK